MKIKSLLLIILLFIGIHTLSLRAVIVSGSRWKINGKTLILLGDYHVRTLHDKDQIKLIEELLKKKNIQCFFEGLPVETINVFDFYKKGHFGSHENVLANAIKIETQDQKSMEEDHNIDFNKKTYSPSLNLSRISFSYYKTLKEFERYQSELLHKISNYSQEIQKNENFLDIFLNDFKDLNLENDLNTLLDFFGRKYHLSYLARQVLDIRLSFDLAAMEFSKNRLTENLMKAYCKKLFMDKKRKYEALAKNLKEKNKNETVNKLSEWYEEECKKTSSMLDAYVNILDSSYFEISFFEKVVHELPLTEFEMKNILNAHDLLSKKKFDLLQLKKNQLNRKLERRLDPQNFY